MSQLIRRTVFPYTVMAIFAAAATSRRPQRQTGRQLSFSRRRQSHRRHRWPAGRRLLLQGRQDHAAVLCACAGTERRAGDAASSAHRRPGSDRSRHVPSGHLDVVRRHQRLRLLANQGPRPTRGIRRTSRTSGLGKGSFAVRNEYLDQKDPSKVVCNEIARYTFLARPAGYLLLWDSTFSSDQEFYFGDQEEMGLGFRVATPLRVGASGKGNSAAGQRRRSSIPKVARMRDEIWGNSAEWCDLQRHDGGRNASA